MRIEFVSVVAIGLVAVGLALAQGTKTSDLHLRGDRFKPLVYNEMTTGASDDIERATNLARRMVTEFGMSEALGPIKFGQAEREVFLGRDYGHQANYSDEVATRIDTEIRELVESAHA